MYSLSDDITLENTCISRSRSSCSFTKVVLVFCNICKSIVILELWETEKRKYYQTDGHMIVRSHTFALNKSVNLTLTRRFARC